MEDILYLDRFDLAYRMNLKNAINIATGEELDVLVHSNNINDIVNLYNCFRCLVLALNNSDIKDNLDAVKAGKCNIAKALAEYVGKLDSSNFLSVYEILRNCNKEPFWSLIDEYKVYKRLRPCINALLNNHPHALSFIVRYKDICKYFDKEIREYMLTDPRTSELIVFKFKVQGYQDTYLPNSLTIEDVELLFDRYIDSDDPNINLLAAISNFGSFNGKNISSKTKFKAKKRFQELQEKQNADSDGKCFIAQKVSLSDELSEPYKVDFKGNESNFIVSLNYLKAYNEPIQRFHILQFLIGLLDSNGLISQVNKISESGVIERTILKPFIGDYLINISCQAKNALASMLFRMYYEFLLTEETSVEDIIVYYFDDYLPNEFGINCFKIANPKSLNYLQGCRNVSAVFESVLKQYKMFVENGDINFEFLEAQEDVVLFSKVPSAVKNKYIKLTDEVLNDCMYAIFSDQSMLSYQEKFYKQNKHFNNFYKLMKAEDVYKQDYNEFYHPRLQYLVDNSIITIADNGKIEYCNKSTISLLKDFFYDGVVSVEHGTFGEKQIIKDWIQDGRCMSYDTLFTEDEASYFNFFLNKREFANGLSLRNGYMHGTLDYKTEEEHKSNYLVLLRLLVQVVLKINDDLCLAYDQKGLA